MEKINNHKDIVSVKKLFFLILALFSKGKYASHCNKKTYRFVGLLSVHVHLVLLGVDGHRSNSQLVASTEDSNRDFT
jgi:hypothetical protein